MIKMSSILNTLFALTLLGLVGLMLIFGYHYYTAADNSAMPSIVDISENNTIQSVISTAGLSASQLGTAVVDDARSGLEVAPESRPVSQAPVPASPVVQPAPKKRLISLYPDDSEKYPAFTTLEKDNGIVVYSAGPEWTEIISAKGVPVWVRGDLVKSIGNGYVEVIINRVNARSAPNTESSAVIGSLLFGEVLKVSRKHDGWVRAWSPIRFRAWAKTKDLAST